jgi:hypothetical protein
MTCPSPLSFSRADEMDAVAVWKAAGFEFCSYLKRRTLACAF